MSSANADAVSGEFSAKQANPNEGRETGGHQPGKLVGNDAVPEFHVQTLPAGTAEKIDPEHTFKPNTAEGAVVDQEETKESK